MENRLRFISSGIDSGKFLVGLTLFGLAGSLGIHGASADEVSNYLEAREAELCVQIVDGNCADSSGFKKDFVKQTHVIVPAAVPQVWGVLLDVGKYGEWNSFMPYVRSDLGVGDKLLFKCKLNNGYSGYEYVKISTRNENQELCWGSRPLGSWMVTQRCKYLYELSDGSTLYYTTEKFQGWVAEQVVKQVGASIQEGIEREASDLAKICSKTIRHQIVEMNTARAWFFLPLGE